MRNVLVKTQFQTFGINKHHFHFVRALDADGGLAGNALDQDGFGLQGQAQIFGEANNPAVLDAGFRLEFERGYDRAGVDLRDASLDVEFLALGFDGTRALLQFLFVELPAALAFVQQRGRRKFVTLVALRNLGLAGFLDCWFFRIAMKNKNRRFRDAGLAVFVSSFRFRLIGQGATGFEKGSSVDRLWRHRLSSGKARFFDSAAHTLLLAALAPVLPARLGPLAKS